METLDHAELVDLIVDKATSREAHEIATETFAVSDIVLVANTTTLLQATMY
jgi:hypothetical protein